MWYPIINTVKIQCIYCPAARQPRLNGKSKEEAEGRSNMQI